MGTQKSGRTARPRLIRFAIGGIVVLLLGLGYWSMQRKPEAPPLPTAAAELSDIKQTVQSAGILQAKLKVDIGAQVSGQIKRLHVQLGQKVAKGELLVSLDPELARNDVQQAEASLARQATVVESREIDVAAARRELERQRRLFKGEATSGVEAEKAETDLAKLEADLRGQSATLAQLKADLGKKQLALGYTSITAPMDGEVVSIAVQEGQTVTAVQTTPLLLTLAKLDVITVRARVAEADIQSISVGQEASFVTLAGKGKRYSGRVRVIQPIPERAGNAVFYNVLFDVDNAAHELLSDMTVQVDLVTGRAEKSLSVPIVALGARQADGRYAVFVQGADGKPAQRLIRTGLQDSARVQVLDGLKAGEKVLLVPPPEAADGAASGASAASAASASAAK
jgi:macrolide-specific efflux system membrane fusion protein